MDTDAMQASCTSLFTYTENNNLLLFVNKTIVHVVG